MRRALREGIDDREARLWWASHAGNATLLKASLELTDEHSFGGPMRLPKDPADLYELTRWGLQLRSVSY